MKASELKEVFDIFITKLDENKEIMDANQKMFEASQILAEEKNKILLAIDNKASQISSYRPHINYNVPELEQFSEKQKLLTKENAEALSNVFKTGIREMETAFKRNKDDKGKLYVLIAFLVLLLGNFCFLSYGVNQNEKKNQLMLQVKSLRKTADLRGKYIEEKGLKEKYKKWLDKQP